MAANDHADVLNADPTGERALIRVLSRDFQIWARIGDGKPVKSAEEARREADNLLIELYRGEYRSLVRLAVLLGHDELTAKEVVQDAFIAVHTGWRRLRDPGMALSYLRQAVVNRSRAVLRQQAVADNTAPKQKPDEPSADAKAIMELEERSTVIAALRRLPIRQREVIVLRYYADLSEAEIARAMSLNRGVVKSHMAHAMFSLRTLLERETRQPGSGYPAPTAVALPVSIYLADEAIHARVEAAVEEWFGLAGLAIEERDPPIIGSWFRRMRVTAKAALGSDTAKDLGLAAVHAADARIVLAQDAATTATLLANLGPVITSLQPTKDAVLRVGALLIVKVDWALQVIQLTAAQQAILDHRPQLASAPHEIVAALQLPQPAAEPATSLHD